tara:strand:+ start:315 stop:524 length:210 start_codon:yes stop_codon:yes gene_type:complete
MYRIQNFKDGDHIYMYKESRWEYRGQVVCVTQNAYGLNNKQIKGIVMVNKKLFESQGYIGRQLDPKRHQ